MHDRLLQRQAELADTDLERHARELGMDVDRFRRSLEDRAHETRIREDLASASASGARGTPSLFINGEPYRGPLEREAVIAALARAAVAVTS
jgi:predicted DsbA family dithiol-disulfide isomerase